jgi:hypothetical protein
VASPSAGGIGYRRVRLGSLSVTCGLSLPGFPGGLGTETRDRMLTNVVCFGFRGVVRAADPGVVGVLLEGCAGTAASWGCGAMGGGSAWLRVATEESGEGIGCSSRSLVSSSQSTSSSGGAGVATAATRVNDGVLAGGVSCCPCSG